MKDFEISDLGDVGNISDLADLSDLTDVPDMEEAEFKSIYETVKDSPEAVAELDSIMQEVIDGMKSIVEKYEALVEAAGLEPSGPADPTNPADPQSS